MTLLSKINRFYLFHGEDEYSKMVKVKDLVNEVITKDFESFDFDYFDGRGLDAATVINAASSPPFGSPLRVVLVRNFNKMSPKNQEMIIRFLDSIPEYATLVLTSGKLDGKDRKKKVYKTLLSRKGYAYEFAAPTAKQAADLLNQWAKELGVELGDGAVEYLIETVGLDIGILNQELQKLATYVGDDRVISEADVANLTGAGTLGTVFDLPVRIVEGDMEKAYKLLNKLLLTKASEGTILFRIKDFFLKLNMIKCSNSSAWILVRNFKYTQKAADFLVKLAPGLSFDRLMNCFHHIYESEISLKSARMRKDLILIDLISRLGMEIAGE
jgi:DNA polymerase-3 subunit delta